jgi:hypothetical protein
MAQDLVFLDLLTCGGVFFGAPREVGEELHPAGCGYSMRVVFAFLDSVFDARPGAVIVTMNGVLAKHYAGPGRGGGPSSAFAVMDSDDRGRVPPVARPCWETDPARWPSGRRIAGDHPGLSLVRDGSPWSPSLPGDLYRALTLSCGS